MVRLNLTKKKNSGFTLVELVIVILVLGIITAVAAPKMFNTASDARDSATRQSLSVLRGAIEMYRAQNGGYPSASALTTTLLPYLQGPFPAPQAGANQNPEVVASSQNPITSVEPGNEGWVYNNSTGEIRINDGVYISW